MKYIKRKWIILIIIIMLILNFFTIQVKAFTFNINTYFIDPTGKYILDVKSYTTIREFKNNIKYNRNITIFGLPEGINEEFTLIKTGDKVEIDGESYIVIVSGDLNGDGKVTYKDILMENDYLENGKGSDRYDYEGEYKSNSYSKNTFSDLKSSKILNFKNFNKEMVLSKYFRKENIQISNALFAIW